MQYNKIKRIIAFTLVFLLVLSLGITAFASESSSEFTENEEVINNVENEPEEEPEIEIVENEPEEEPIKKEQEQPVQEEKQEEVEIVVEEKQEEEKSKDNIEAETQSISSSESITTSQEETSTETIVEETTITTEEENETSITENITENEITTEEITEELTTEELTTEEETLTDTQQNLSNVFSDTQIMTYSGYMVSLTCSSGINSYSVHEKEDNIVQLYADDYSQYFTWDGWYINGQKISSEKNCEYTVESDVVIEARTIYKDISYTLYFYVDESDSAMIKITNTPQIWIAQGTYRVPNNVVEEFARTGFVQNNTIIATEIISDDETLQKAFTDSGLDYKNYQYRFVYAEDGIHLDSVISSANFPEKPSGIENVIETIEIIEEPKNVGPISFAVDGVFTEWIDYPHVKILSYSGGDDAYSCIYRASSDTLFNVYTEMPAHLAEGGGEFTSGISVLLNDDWGLAFYPRFINVDSSGNINWNPQLVGLPEGTYHFYLASTDAWHTSTNTNNLHEMDKIYGDAYIHISDTRDEIEWRLDMNMIANKLNIAPSEIKSVKVSYSRLGPEWTISAGTPTGLPGIIICITIAGIGFVIYNKRK